MFVCMEEAPPVEVVSGALFCVIAVPADEVGRGLLATCLDCGMSLLYAIVSTKDALFW